MNALRFAPRLLFLSADPALVWAQLGGAALTLDAARPDAVQRRRDRGQRIGLQLLDALADVVEGAVALGLAGRAADEGGVAHLAENLLRREGGVLQHSAVGHVRRGEEGRLHSHVRRGGGRVHRDPLHALDVRGGAGHGADGGRRLQLRRFQSLDDFFELSERSF